MKKNILVLTCLLLALAVVAQKQTKTSPKSFSGVYPSLAMYNNEGECGTGAVVPWADRLWVITYGPHLPFGSSDKLYQITPELKQIVCPQSIGGTPANRMIHKESNQLFIGPYAIDANRTIRTISWRDMPGRLTGNARSMTDPAGKILFGTMEEGFYEVDVKTLKPTVLFQDGNINATAGFAKTAANLPGVHGKGLYSGQGVMVFSNNGEGSYLAERKFDIEAGVLAEWDGKDWKVVRRNQFVEVTGPGGIYGNANAATDPIWATGWDFKSTLLGVRADGKWTFYRLPKASHSYDGAHGWNTEWPRIRNIGTEQQPDYLMTMHGMFWNFPAVFTPQQSAGIRPRSAYLKVVGDFARWNNQLVMGCDDSAQKEFLNKRKVKGNCEGPGQSNSNLWFMSLAQPDKFGPATAEGAVWISENIKAQELSDPFLFAGWDYRTAWIKNEGTETVTFRFETDKKGTGSWSDLQSVAVAAGQSAQVVFDAQGEWVRVSTDKDTKATVHFSYTEKDVRTTTPDAIFKGIAQVNAPSSVAGIMWGLGNNRRALGMLAGKLDASKFTETGYYELDSTMQLVKKNDPKTAEIIRTKFAIPTKVVTVDASSVLVVDDNQRRWRLPLGSAPANALTSNSLTRICREVATERDLFQCAGTFYELPAENADGFAKIRPVASHNFRIYDYASYRGLLVMTGIDAATAKTNSHIIRSADGKAAVWAGTIDDIWKMGKPTGHGGPWKNAEVKANVPSDPYLIGFYDKRSLQLSHGSDRPIEFTIEVEPIGHGPWMTYQKITVLPTEIYRFNFPSNFQSRWIRFVASSDCNATAWLTYE